ncbi:hypothetical protein GCM10009832_10840 [Dietzia kunjamensis subsp. schimae]|uniref:T3SS (YopN, CesT) and YbjN peptide-binding chaperone 1 n=1 Tax=Dietzia kunjamensis TaxID=322509 RepID=UPI0012B96BC9|nr:hypothetical protein [Dietzia kunjamensis]MBB1015608.1 hypothetical protein [Dietzia kunjamensis subsp. schimae]
MQNSANQGEFDPYAAYRPTDPEDFANAVADALRQNYGHRIDPNEDGGYPIQIGSGGMVITPRQDGVLSIVSVVVSGMDNPPAAALVVDRLNEHTSFARFQILDDLVVASCDAPALPFVPQHLYTLINTVGHALDIAGPEITAVAGGMTVSDIMQS